MVKYDVYKNTDGEGLLLDLQSDLLDGMATRVVAPLIPQKSAPPPARRLNPVFLIDGAPYVLIIQSLAAVPLNLLTHAVGNLE